MSKRKRNDYVRSPFERARQSSRKKRTRESRYMFLDMFLSNAKLSRGFMCLFISAGFLDAYREAEYACTGVHAAVGPCRLEVAFSFNPFVLTFPFLSPRLFSFLSLNNARFATTGPQESFPRDLGSKR